MSLHSQEHEQFVLGALLIGVDGRDALAGLVADEGLRPEHFTRTALRLIFEAMLRLADAGTPVDPGTVIGELEGQDVKPALVHTLPTLVPVASNYRAYAKVLVDLADRARIVTAGRAIIDGAESGDRDKIAEGEGMLTGEHRGRRVSREDRQDRVVELLEQGGGERWPWPFRELNDYTSGGARRGQLTILFGIEGHGKSAFLRQVMDHFHSHGASACVYTNEMAVEEIDLRFVARESGVPYLRLARADVRDGEHGKVTKAIERIGRGIEIVPADGWTVDEVCHDIKRQRWDTCALDHIMGLIGRKETSDFDRTVGLLAACSRQVDCHLIAVHHMNTHRGIGRDYPPEPAIADIRGSAAFRQLANNVMAIYRREEEIAGEGTGNPGEDSVIKFLKVRGGIPGSVGCRFDGGRLRFLANLAPGMVGAAA